MHYPLNSAIDSAMTYGLDSDLSGGQRYPRFEQLRRDEFLNIDGTFKNDSSPACVKLVNVQYQGTG